MKSLMVKPVACHTGDPGLFLAMSNYFVVSAIRYWKKMEPGTINGIILHFHVEEKCHPTIVWAHLCRLNIGITHRDCSIHIERVCAVRPRHAMNAIFSLTSACAKLGHLIKQHIVCLYQCTQLSQLMWNPLGRNPTISMVPTQAAQIWLFLFFLSECYNTVLDGQALSFSHYHHLKKEKLQIRLGITKE